MSEVELRMTVGDGNADRALAGVVQMFESAFPGRIVGYYIHGSGADHTAVSASDLDLDIVVRGGFTDSGERDALLDLARRVAGRSRIELDLDITDEATLELGADPNIKLGSRLLFGQDIRPDVPLISVEQWGRERMHAGYFLLMTVFKRQPPARLPLGFPNHEDEFFGYTNRSILDEQRHPVPSTRNLVRVTGWLGTALLAHEAGHYVVSKSECHRLYRQHVNDEWATLLDELYTVCRGAWSYRLPTDSSGRRQLRAMCERTLAFENHFLARYRPFLIEELARGKEDSASRARWLMEQIPFEDPAITAVS
jgi:hypothetical protein